MNTKFMIHLMRLCLVCMLFAACADQDEGNNEGEPSDLYLAQLNMGTRVLPDNLECNLYIFKKELSDTDFVLSEIVAFGHEDGKYLKFLYTELLNHDYRFFFMATDPDNMEISLKNNVGSPIAVNEKWTNLRIMAAIPNLSTDIYYEVLDKSGSSILNEGGINATLTRMVGQITLDIFRTDGSINKPVPVQSADVESVIDRVFQIDLRYKGLTKAIAFDNNGDIVESEQWPDSHLQTIIPVMGASQKVTLPQEDKGLLISGQDVAGSVRIMGLCGLPATKKIQVVATFHYYDTTQIPGSPGAGNDSDSFMIKELTLNIPKDSNPDELLKIASDYFTVNLAGIRYDRIIDIGVNGSYSFNTTWDIYE